MPKPSDVVEGLIVPHRTALEEQLAHLDGLDPEVISSAEMKRCQKLAQRLRAAINKLKPPEVPAWEKPAPEAPVGPESDTAIKH